DVYKRQVPETSPYTVTLPYTPIDGSILMVDQDGKPVTEAETTPSAGSYTILDDELTFNAADKGKTLFVCFDYTALAVKSFGLPKSGSRPAMQAVISGEGMGEDESTFYDVAIIIDKCKATGNINPPEMSREPKPQNITLKVLKPRGNNKAVDFKFAARA
ncbi:MAG: hypothetical protein N2376_01210, partial [Clostridia bacterium]|nr:hypothetical protein [Clostridia bacterium]